MKKTILLLAMIAGVFFAQAQGVTSGQLSGFITDEEGKAISDATVTLTDLDKNTSQTVFSNKAGKYQFLYVKAGDRYQLSASFVGKEAIVSESFSFRLGENAIRNLSLDKSVVEVAEVQIEGSANDGFHSLNPSNETYLDNRDLRMFPSPNRSLLDYISISPYAGSTGFLGQGSRANYISIDGSGFNNIYGIGGPTAALIGNVVGAEPFGVDAVEAIQFDINPYDVRQGGFTGASINAITKSGSNKYSGSIYSYFGHDALVGSKVGDDDLPVANFSNNRFGASFGGPLIKNKLFFFVNVEANDITTPAANFVASDGTNSGDNVTRVSETDLEELSTFLKDNYDYDTGPYQSYDNKTKNQKILVKLDYLLSERNRISLRYNYLTASMEDNNTNSGSFGSGNRVENLLSMSYQNSGQTRTVKATSVVGELVSNINSNLINKLSLAYSYFPDSRAINGSLFPSVDILKQGKTYISFGSHLFASANRIDQSVLNFKNEISTSKGNHLLTAGVNVQLFDFKYEFTPAFAGSFIFNSIEDFYNSTPIGTSTPNGLSNGIGRPSTYARRYATAEGTNGLEVNPKFTQYALFLQDQYQTKRFNLTAGVRLEYNTFGGDPLTNTNVSALTFQDQEGMSEQLLTGRLPESHLVISPRIGLSISPTSSGRIKIRGGLGIFSGLPSMVRIGDQFVNNGLLEGEIKAKGNQANQYPFNPDPEAYIPEDLNNPATYDVNTTVADYKGPQILRSNVGIDVGLSSDVIFSVDGTYSKDLYRDHVRNANLDQSSALEDENGRFIFTSSNLNSPPILGAYVLDNFTSGDQYFLSFQLRKSMRDHWFASATYTFGESKDLNSFGASSTRSAFRNLPVAGNTNDPGIAFSDFDLRHKMVLFIGTEFDGLKIGKTNVALFFTAVQEGRYSYTYAGNGDVNNDGVPSNDLIYVPSSIDNISLEQYNQNGNPVSIESQWEALDAFISSSSFLNENRGQIIERNGGILPWLSQANLRITQEVRIGETNNGLEFMLDLFNLTNLINSEWGVRKLVSNTRPIQAMQNGNFRVNPSSLNEEFIDDIGLASRWQIQFGARYRFN